MDGGQEKYDFLLGFTIIISDNLYVEDLIKVALDVTKYFNKVSTV